MERQELNRKRSSHLDHVFALRKPYEDSKVRCQTDRTFQSIIIDGADNQKCSCPHQWRYYVRREEKPDSAVEQKIETVIVHGTVMNFYVCPPFIPTGITLLFPFCWTVYLMSLQRLKSSESNLMVFHFFLFFIPYVCEWCYWYVGGSENVNYSVHVLCALLVHHGVFREVYTNRLPVG